MSSGVITIRKVGIVSKRYEKLGTVLIFFLINR
jgi:hypothetical protein